MKITFFVLTASIGRYRQLLLSARNLPCRTDLHFFPHTVRLGSSFKKETLNVYRQAQSFEGKGWSGFLQDDTIFSPTFCSDVEHLIQRLPSSWEILHLCPGFSWGRNVASHKSDESFSFRPEREFGFETELFWNGPPARDAWLGGPIAFITRKSSAYNDIIHHIEQGMGIIDIDHTNVALANPICAGSAVAKKMMGGFRLTSVFSFMSMHGSSSSYVLRKNLYVSKQGYHFNVYHKKDEHDAIHPPCAACRIVAADRAFNFHGICRAAQNSH